MYAAFIRLTFALLDVTNCFQNTLIPAKDRACVTLPNFYMEWFKREYPQYELEASPSGKYVLQAQKGLQGDKQIGQQ